MTRHTVDLQKTLQAAWSISSAALSARSAVKMQKTLQIAWSIFCPVIRLYYYIRQESNRIITPRPPRTQGQSERQIRRNDYYIRQDSNRIITPRPARTQEQSERQICRNLHGRGERTLAGERGVVTGSIHRRRTTP